MRICYPGRLLHFYGQIVKILRKPPPYGLRHDTPRLRCKKSVDPDDTPSRLNVVHLHRSSCMDMHIAQVARCNVHGCAVGNLTLLREAVSHARQAVGRPLLIFGGFSSTQSQTYNMLKSSNRHTHRILHGGTAQLRRYSAAKALQISSMSASASTSH